MFEYIVMFAVAFISFHLGLANGRSEERSRQRKPRRNLS
jgi:hypothetical protein